MLPPLATKESDSASPNEWAWRHSCEGGPTVRQIGSRKDPRSDPREFPREAQAVQEVRKIALRCAVYTRVSTDSGLEQDFNSPDNQREASEAYIKSQAHEGWRLVRERYDDGGFSGGSMERPVVQKLSLPDSQPIPPATAPRQPDGGKGSATTSGPAVRLN